MRKLSFVSILILIFFFLFLPSSLGLLLAIEQPLEAEYPEIGGIQPKAVSIGLPDYVNYIFKLAVVIIGFVIFGVLVYAGASYLFSAGNPAKLTDAKEGIMSAFLGGVILLSAFLIFNTINPQLTIFELKKVPLLESAISEGIYICGDDFSKPEYGINLEEVLDWYINGTSEQHNTAVEILSLLKPGCVRVIGKKDFNIEIKNGYSMFIIPELKKVVQPDGTLKRQPIYNYAIILRSENKQKGKCDFFPKRDSNFRIFTVQDDEHQIDELKVKDLKFNARSATVIKKTPVEPPSYASGVFLFPCVAFDTTGGTCPDSVTDYKPAALPPEYASAFYSKDVPDLFEKVKENTRSILINPEGFYVALLFDEDDYNGNCGVIANSMSNIVKIGLEHTGKCNVLDYLNPFNWKKDCVTRLRSAIAIQAQMTE